MIQYYKRVFIQSARSLFSLSKFAWLFWITNMVFAAALTIPLSTVLGEHLGNSLINRALVEQFDYQWYLQFRSEYASVVTAFPAFIFSIVVIYMFIQLFYTGGLLSVILNREKNHYVDFFYGGVKYFIRYTKVFFAICLLYLVALMFEALLTFSLSLVLGRSPNAFIFGSITALKYLVFLFLITLINIMADYSKVVIAVGDRFDILRVLHDAFIFIKKNADKVFVVYLAISSFVVIAATGYNIVDGYLPKRPIVLLLPTFIIQQILIIFRVLIKMYFFTSEVYLYQDLASEYTEVTTEEIETGENK